MDLVVGQPGSFAREEANLVELNSHIPHARKSENMKANKSFMVFTSVQFSLYWSVGEIELKSFKKRSGSLFIQMVGLFHSKKILMSEYIYQ